MYTFTFVTSLLEKACIFCRAKLSNQLNNIGDKHGNFVKLSPTPPAYTLYELSMKINFSLSIGVAFSSLLSFTSVNLIGCEFNSVSDFQACSGAGRTVDIALLTCSPIYHVQVRSYFGSSRYKVVLNDLE